MMQLQNFEVITPLFEGQVNERFQFKLTLEGNDYRGIVHHNEVQWFQPHPQNTMEETKVNFVESNIRSMM